MKRYRLRYADWSWREYATAAACIVRGHVTDGPARDRLAQALDLDYAPSRAFLVNYGHTALRIALDAFRQRRPDRKQVIIPAYICPSVVDTVRAAGLVPVAAEVGGDLNIMPDAVAELIGPTTLAVVVPHMFGCPAAVDVVERLCLESDVFMVDDAAQVVGERLDGRLLGTFGDVGIVSFAQSKAVVTGVRGSGGVLIVNRQAWLEDMRAACARLRPARGRLRALLHFLWNYQWSAYTGQSAYYVKRLHQAISKRSPRSPGEQAGTISNLDAAIALVQLARLPNVRVGKLRVLKAYQHALSTTGVSMPQYADGRYLSRVMLSMPSGTDIVQLRQRLASDGVQTRLGYLNKCDEGVADSPNVAAARRMIGLPFHSTLRNDVINEICSILTKNLAAQGLPVSSTTTQQ